MRGPFSDAEEPTKKITFPLETRARVSQPQHPTHLGQMMPCCGGRPMHMQNVCSIPGPDPLDAREYPPVVKPKMSPDIAKHPCTVKIAPPCETLF